MEKQHKRTAIVIDDHPDVLSLFVELLEIRNFQVVATGNNGAQGVELYKKFKPNVTFLDVVMPNTDGFYALERIREIDSDAIVIMVTTDLSENTSRRLKELRASSIVYKPFTIDDLVKIVVDIESEPNLNRNNFFN